MPTGPSPASDRLRFGEFEVDLRSHELLRAGRRLRLQEKSFLVLHELLQHPGQVVTREQLAAALWPKEYFVDAEHGLNTAVRRLREALGDSAGAARYIETLPRVGYRFIGRLESPSESIDALAGEPKFADATGPPPVAPAESIAPASPERDGPVPTSSPRSASSTLRRRGAWFAAALLVALAVVAAVTSRARTPPPLETAAGTAMPTPGAEPGDLVDELLDRARYLRNTKRFEEAQIFVERALVLEPRNSEALAGLALGLIGEGRDEQAREIARRALEIDPNAWEAHRALGNLARGAGDLAGAERHLRRAVEANPTDQKSRNRLARHLLECGRLEEAREHIERNRRLAPDDPDVQNIRIDYALRAGDFESAIRQAETWLVIWEKQLATQSARRVRDQLGLALVGARRHEEALAHFRAAAADDDLRMALALGYAGRIGEARAILAAHEAENPGARDSADPRHDGAMAMAYVVLGDFDRAFAHLELQVAARAYPGWLNSKLFHPIRQDPRWPAFARQLELEFFSGKAQASAAARDAFPGEWPEPVPDADSQRPSG